MKNNLIKFGVCLIIVGILSSFLKNGIMLVNAYNDDAKMVREIKQVVEENNKIFLKEVEVIKEDMKSTSLLFIEYLEKIPSNNKIIVEKFNNIEAKINSIDSQIKIIDSNCTKYVSDLKICREYNVNYSNMIDAYLNLISNYNLVVEKYNKSPFNKNKNNVNLYVSTIEKK